MTIFKEQNVKTYQFGSESNRFVTKAEMKCYNIRPRRGANFYYAYTNASSKTKVTKAHLQILSKQNEKEAKKNTKVSSSVDNIKSEQVKSSKNSKKKVSKIK